VDGRLAAAASHVIALDALLVVLAPWDAEPGLTTALVASTGSALVAARALARRVMSMRRRRAADTVRVVLVADPGAMESITRRLSDAVADRVSVLPLPVSAPGSDASVRRIAATVAEHDPDVVVVDAGALHVAPLRSLLWSLERFRAQAVVLPRLVGVADARLATTTSGGIPLLHIQPPTRDGLLVPVKGILERIVAGAALVVLAPLLGAIALVVRATSRGPALFLQTRIGQHGRPFRMVKFRSMTVDAEKHRVELLHLNDAADGLLFKIRSDPRVTRFGRILRRYSLDELPQLWNVVTGSMSLVGPRPALPSEVEAYDDTVRRRLLVKPGLTGLWQVNGRSDLSWEDAVRLDLHYVDNWSLAGDVTIVSRTVGAVLRNSGAY
jgi:exopolysaccharide biosynthesis polyprenyl glycosylphosphotransferase